MSRGSLRCHGYTLVEVTITLAVFIILSGTIATTFRFLGRTSDRVALGQRNAVAAHLVLGQLAADIRAAGQIALDNDRTLILRLTRQADGALVEYRRQPGFIITRNGRTVCDNAQWIRTEPLAADGEPAEAGQAAMVRTTLVLFSEGVHRSETNTYTLLTALRHGGTP